MITFRNSFVKKLTLLTAAAILLWLAASSTAKTVGQTSAQRRELNFSHQQHASDAGMECAQCHAAAKSASGTDDLLPGHSVCTECHDVNAADGCKLCHQNAAPKLSKRMTASSPIFSHQLHIEKGKLQCAVCHADLDGVLLPEQAGHLPKMSDCMTCHTREHVKNDCKVCHLPSDDLVPANHKLEWTSRHGIEANTDESCNACHTTDACLKCHNGDPLFNPHPRNYMARHGQDAHLSDISCSVCHEERDFCNDCHRQMNILPAGHFRPGWIGGPEGGDHAERAQFDLESCMACHDAPGQNPVCARCHGK